ncbi:hypothetical protein [Neptuniibacter sp. QD57_21]|uniref:hypothetical protein n=1 Tax=Neptuniibacter sp. QD57_21 TaxID=3398213 RepID=UPI0039F48BAD
MRIKMVAFGDSGEAFIEKRFKDGVNIIFSDDNNRGKTLVMQGLMFSLGYEAIFPSSFEYNEKYFYSKIEVGGVDYEFLRKKNSIAIKYDGFMQIFNGIGELRYFLDRYVMPIPAIIKDGRNTLVDLSLYYEIFFIGQDNRNPSGLISKGRFNKLDFKSMVYGIAGLSGNHLSIDEINNIKEEIKSLKIKQKDIRKKISIVRENPRIAEISSKFYDSESVQRKIRAISGINNDISKAKRTRQREINRRSRLEQLISELNSLNRELKEGDVKCADCGSDKIVYSNNDLTFEISNLDVRQGIIRSIEYNISQKSEIIMDLSQDINNLQSKINEEMKYTPPNFKEIILYQDEAIKDVDYDEELFVVSNKIKQFESELRSFENITTDLKENRNGFDLKLLEEMNDLYRVVDPSGNLVFEDIFTKRGSTFSGSEGQEFYFCKVVALKKIVDHDFPIIIDSFRDGELSSSKEEKMLGIYKTIGGQVILTSTLKTEEYKNEKYSKIDGVNSLDYSIHQGCKILNKRHSADFVDIISSFNGIVV